MSDIYISYATEIKEIESLLAMIPPENVLERRGLESRLNSVRSDLEKYRNRNGIRSRANLTFRGRPVVKSHGIMADFAAQATKLFSEAYAKIAADLAGRLSSAGPIPNRGNNQLMIVGTAIGSYGFEFELPESDVFPNMRVSEQAISSIIDLFKLSATGSDDAIADVIENVHPRAISGIYDFLRFLNQEEAWCGVEFAQKYFKYEGSEQQKNSADRLKKENIKENDETFVGEFQGILPAGRTFEFKLHDQEGMIRGKIGAEISEPDILNREWLHKKATITLHGIQVGEGRTRYLLPSLDSVQATS